jgi:hypothetical protein
MARRAPLRPLLAAALALALASSPRESRAELAVGGPPAPAQQTLDDARAKSSGCFSCHAQTDRPTMHRNPGVLLGCTDCHGGDAGVSAPSGLEPASAEYRALAARAHVAPRQPDLWARAPANPSQSYTLLNRESPEYVRFVNPGDLRVADRSCGACHGDIVERVQRSLMATTAMFWGGAAYNNGIAEFKRYVLGEAYTPDGEPAAICVKERLPDGTLAEPCASEVPPELAERGVLPRLLPLPAWETWEPADNFRIFERGGRFIGNIFPEIGLPNPLEEPGKPDARQSNRGPATGARISVPLLNIHKTRLNDPLLWFLGTNDNPGDYRSSGCTACHTVYANDRSPVSSGSWAVHGNEGQTATVDPTLRDRRDADGAPERGHPIRHELTTAIPSSQCMTCHHHQPNMFVNSYLGYTMWDYESDAPLMWPETQRHPGSAEMREILDRNPEEAGLRGRWADAGFLARVWQDVNPQARDTQFADYHGHGWNFRAVFKRDRDGTLLDEKGQAVPDHLPPSEKWKRAVHMMDIHAERGMQCADCHFELDSHGDGNLYGEVAAAIEIRCQDCHGTADALATLRTSGPAAPPGGTDLSLLRNVDGRRRFVWRDAKLHQRLVLPPHEERPVTQVRDTVDPTHPAYNARAARAKTLAAGPSLAWGPSARGCRRAHGDQKLACFSCHSSWVTSCAGCHLPIQANWKTERHHYEGGETRNFATYNPQVARDEMFQLGRHGVVKDGIIAPIRSSSALVLSSTDINRNRIYVQQPPISAAGFSSQAFAPHFPHTVRETETKQCSDCHVSRAGDNNAIMAQLLLLGTRFVDFVGLHAWVGTDHGIEAIQVTEWDEPQAVLGSYLHRHAYPDWYAAHVEREREIRASRGSSPVSVHHHPTKDGVGCLQLRGEYLFVAEGDEGMQAYDVANVGNKGFSERFVTAPFSPLGQNLRIDSRDATCVALPTNQPIRPERNREIRQEHPENLEQPMHPVYSYAAITDAEEGLILTDVETLTDFEPRNNFLRRALTWNPDHVLDGARHAVFAGHVLYVSAERGVAVVDLDRPLEPRLLAVIPLERPRAAALQFRYLFVSDASGLRVVDVTHPERPRLVPGAEIPLAEAHGLHVARTYAYVAAGAEGLAIVDVERPEAPRLVARFGGGGELRDARDVVVATTNASLFAYVADGAHGLKVLQLTSPELQPGFYGFSPEPRPELIAWRRTRAPALSLSRGLERDRGVDETGEQIAVFGRLGSRPFNLEEMQRLYLRPDGSVWTVGDEVAPPGESPACPSPTEGVEVVRGGLPQAAGEPLE